MKAHEAKGIIKAELDKRELPYDRLSAKTISFVDMGRGDCVFVKIHGWKPSPVYGELEAIAKTHGFRIEAGF